MIDYDSRFAAATAGLPTAALAPLRRAWVAATPFERAAMAILAERRFGAESVPDLGAIMAEAMRRANAAASARNADWPVWDPTKPLRDWIWGDDEKKPPKEDPVADLTRALIRVEQYVAPIRERYLELCSTTRKALTEVVHEWQEENPGRKVADLNPDEWAEIYKRAHARYPSLGFDNPKGSLCIDSDDDLAIREWLRTWEDERKKNTAVVTAPASALDMGAVYRGLNVIDQFARQSDAMRKRMEDFARRFAERTPLPQVPSLSLAPVLLIVALAFGGLLLVK